LALLEAIELQPKEIEMLLKNFAAPLGAILALAISAPAFALNPQPLPPGKLPPYLLYQQARTHTLGLPGHVIVPPICKGPPKTPNPCM
jgi:hypothetical protein